MLEMLPIVRRLAQFFNDDNNTITNKMPNNHNDILNKNVNEGMKANASNDSSNVIIEGSDTEIVELVNDKSEAIKIDGDSNVLKKEIIVRG